MASSLSVKAVGQANANRQWGSLALYAFSQAGTRRWSRQNPESFPTIPYRYCRVKFRSTDPNQIRAPDVKVQVAEGGVHYWLPLFQEPIGKWQGYTINTMIGAAACICHKAAPETKNPLPSVQKSRYIDKKEVFPVRRQRLEIRLGKVLFRPKK